MIGARVSKLNIAVIVIAAAILGLIYWPSLRWMFNSWVSSDYYSHGFLVPVVSAFFIWTRRDQLKKREPSLIGGLWLILAAALYVLSFSLEIRMLGALSVVALIIGLVFVIFGFRVFKALLFPLAFLLFMVPFWFIQDLAYQLQYISVHWSSWIAGVLGLPIKTEGTQIFLGGNITFTVGVVCSGINTLVALLALAAVYAFIQKGPIAKRWGLFLLAVPIAIAANVLRIASIILVAYFVDVKTATGWYHDISSPLFFFIAFGALILVGRTLKLRINYDMFGGK